MKKFTINTVGALLIGLTGSAFAASLDAHTLTNAINNASSTKTNKGFAIVYGGQDISRGSLSLHESQTNQPVLVG